MRTVVRLVEPQPEPDTVAVLRALLARAMAGEVIGVALSYRMRGGAEDAAYTGPYWDRPGEAIKAALKISRRLLEIDEAQFGPP